MHNIVKLTVKECKEAIQAYMKCMGYKEPKLEKIDIEIGYDTGYSSDHDIYRYTVVSGCTVTYD